MTRDEFRKLSTFLLMVMAIVFASTAVLVPSVYGQSAVYQATPPTLSNGQRTDIQVDSTGAQRVSGSVAHDSADSGNPVKIGGVYHGNSYPLLTEGERGNVQMGPSGSLHVQIQGTGLVPSDAAVGYQYGYNVGNVTQHMPGAVGTHLWSGTAVVAQRGDVNGTVVQPALSTAFWRYAAAAGGIVSSVADVAVKTAAGAGVVNYTCSIQISHDTLSAVSELVIKDGASVMWRGKLQTAASDASVGAGTLQFSPCLKGTANTAVNVAMVSSVTGGVFVNLTGYTGS